MPLKLSLPETGESLQPSAEIRPRRIKTWLEALPLANIVEASRSVSDALIALNRTPLDSDTRLKLLEFYTTAINNLVPELQHKYTMVTLPLTEKSHQAANLARRLYVELAYGYKIVLLERLEKKHIRLGGLHLPLLIQRAMAALSKALCAFYHTYSPTPQGMWSEIHQLMQLALQRKLHDEPVDRGRNSVSETYKQTLLLALANPYKLMQGEVDKVAEYLVQYGNLAKLYPVQATLGTLGVFLIDLDSDAPPKSLEQKDGETKMHNHILLSTDVLVSTLNEQIAKLESGRAQKALNLPDHANQASYLNLMRRLLKDWTFMPKRKFKRMANNNVIEICAGLRAICHFVASQPEAAELNTLDFSIDAGSTSPSAGKSELVQFGTSKWSVTNESAGGMGLNCISGITQPIRIGEIIGLRSEDSQNWNIGVVRRVFSDYPEHLELGVQMLAPAATPIIIKPVVAGPKETFQAALLLPEIRPLQQPATIVAAPATFRSKLEYLIYQNNVVSHVRAMQLVEQTASFDQFQFSIE
ncbi:MAG TPA: hypothetical protein VK460_06135 [Burkholderiales bacterium]|nr:hypothetical protein [Burkholderiales bacterium]